MKKRKIIKRDPLARKTSVTAQRLTRARQKGTNVKNSVVKMTTDQKRIAAYELRLDKHSERDIANALGCSQSSVSKYINEQAEINAAKVAELGVKVIQYELDFNDRMIIAWLPKARSPNQKMSSKAAEVVLKYIERSDKLRGLVVNRSEIGGPGGGPIRVNASAIDLSKLNDQQLEWLEEIMRVAGPPLPALEGVAVPLLTSDAENGETNVDDDEEK